MTPVRLVALTLLSLALPATGCGTSEHEGHLKLLIANGWCEIYYSDTPDADNPRGPRPKDHNDYNGAECALWRW